MSATTTQTPAAASTSKPVKSKSKKDKSQKKDKAAQLEASSSAAGFSLLGGEKDAELDDVFGKSVRLVQQYRTLVLIV